MTVQQLLTETINFYLSPASEASASSVVRGALRVAILRQDPLGEYWLRLELQGISATGSPRTNDTLSRLGALVGSEAAEQQTQDAVSMLIKRREIEPGRDGVLPIGIGELEVRVSSLLGLYEDPVTAGMTPLDTGMASIERDKVRSSLAPTILNERSIIERIRNAAFAYMLEAEAELLRGEIVPDVIARGRNFVVNELSLRSPEASEALASAEKRIGEGDDEAMSQAATSCRRAIKALADTLFPATSSVLDDEGVARRLSDDFYRNRLVEYVRSRRGKSTHADILASNLASLGTRLKSLDDLASKGVHVQISRAEAETCLSWTYMLAADLLRIETETPEASTAS